MTAVSTTKPAPAAVATRRTQTDDAGSGATRRRSFAFLGYTPFALYVLLFLGFPAVYAILNGFFTADGKFTFHNLTALGNPVILGDFWTSIWVSAIVAVVSAIAGAVICVALIDTKPGGILRLVIDSASSVFSQFGGIMLAFAFIATVGLQGYLTLFLQSAFGLNINSFTKSPLLYQPSGLIWVYLYFSIPLMVISFMPAVDGLKKTWGEAVATLGGNRFTYWMRVGMPVLAPSFWGCAVLLFASSFSAYATAAALLNQGGIVPLDIQQQMTSETVVGVANTAGVIAFGMVVVMVIVMFAYSRLQRRARRWYS